MNMDILGWTKDLLSIHISAPSLAHVIRRRSQDWFLAVCDVETHAVSGADVLT